MTFQIGNNANPNGRPRKAPDPRSEMVQEFCKKNQKSIEDVGLLLLNKALKEEQPWAIKLAMEMFYPKAGTYAPVEKNTTQNNLNVHMAPLLNNMSQDEHSELWQLLMRAKNRTPAVINVTNDEVE